jgi:hypothetical protein
LYIVWTVNSNITLQCFVHPPCGLQICHTNCSLKQTGHNPGS